MHTREREEDDFKGRGEHVIHVMYGRGREEKHWVAPKGMRTERLITTLFLANTK